MKIQRLETHDRLQHFVKKDSEQAITIGVCVQDIINQRPFGNHPFYIFSHTRTDDDGVTKRLIHQPRLTKPKAQTNSMLFRAYPGSDKVKIIWMIPAREMWKQYKKGNITEDKKVAWSIHLFENNRILLEAKEPDDMTDEQIDAIYRELSQEAKRKKNMNKIAQGIF